MAKEKTSITPLRNRMETVADAVHDKAEFHGLLTIDKSSIYLLPAFIRTFFETELAANPLYKLVIYADLVHNDAITIAVMDSDNLTIGGIMASITNGDYIGIYATRDMNTPPSEAFHKFNLEIYKSLARSEQKHIQMTETILSFVESQLSHGA